MLAEEQKQLLIEDVARGDTFHNDKFSDLKTQFFLADPQFDVSDWGGERLRADQRWQYSTLIAGNASFAWRLKAP